MDVGLLNIHESEKEVGEEVGGRVPSIPTPEPVPVGLFHGWMREHAPKFLIGASLFMAVTIILYLIFSNDKTLAISTTGKKIWIISIASLVVGLGVVVVSTATYLVPLADNHRKYEGGVRPSY